MSVDSAHANTTILLKDRNKFNVVLAQSAWIPGVNNLAYEVVEFFDQFEQVRTTYGDMVLSRAEVAFSRLLPGYVRIGYDAEHAEVLTELGSGKVFVADGSELDLKEDWYPSIYHYVLAVTEDVYGISFT